MYGFRKHDTYVQLEVQVHPLCDTHFRFQFNLIHLSPKTSAYGVRAATPRNERIGPLFSLTPNRSLEAPFVCTVHVQFASVFLYVRTHARLKWIHNAVARPHSICRMKESLSIVWFNLAYRRQIETHSFIQYFPREDFFFHQFIYFLWARSEFARDSIKKSFLPFNFWVHSGEMESHLRLNADEIEQNKCAKLLKLEATANLGTTRVIDMSLNRIKHYLNGVEMVDGKMSRWVRIWPVCRVHR